MHPLSARCTTVLPALAHEGAGLVDKDKLLAGFVFYLVPVTRAGRFTSFARRKALFYR